MLDHVGHKTIICGPESFTPDGFPLFGQTPEVGGLSIAVTSILCPRSGVSSSTVP